MINGCFCGYGNDRRQGGANRRGGFRNRKSNR